MSSGCPAPLRIPAVRLVRTLAAAVALAAIPASGLQSRWTNGLPERPPEWYGTAEARTVADNVLRYQSRHGAWPKNTILAVPPRSPDALAQLEAEGLTDTIDNGATVTPMRFLARMAQATADARYREAFLRGLDYLLAAQYANGGWPQFFPLRRGYYSHITYNDDAMVNVLTLLRDVAAGQPPYAFVDPARRAKAAGAVSRGVRCILRTQVKQDRMLTAWCAQHDQHTLAPAWARNFEPPSLSGAETVGIVRFLMGEPTSPGISAAIEGAVAWLERTAIRGLRVENFTAPDGAPDRRAVAGPAAGPLWARFYELGTNRPIFLGRDRVFHYDYNQVERERRTNYNYLGAWPAALLSADYPRWRAQPQPQAR